MAETFVIAITSPDDWTVAQENEVYMLAENMADEIKSVIDAEPEVFGSGWKVEVSA